jgi:hypothetical protein
MTRLFSAFLAIAMCASLGAVATASTTTGHTTSMNKSQSCPKGQTYVHGYKNKSGKYVKGYCRKS